MEALFIATTLLTVFLFYRAAKSITAVWIILGWLIVQWVISVTGFYKVTDTMPPRFLLLIGPPLLTIIVLLVRANKLVDRLDLKALTVLHVIRIPVELVLWGLFLEKQVPELMTFEGRNFDILSGLTAPIAYYLPRKLLLVWNFVCLGLLINIVVIAVLSAPTPFQQLAFEQPNVGVLRFPFIWLPCCIVPLVLFSHLAAIKKLM